MNTELSCVLLQRCMPGGVGNLPGAWIETRWLSSRSAKSGEGHHDKACPSGVAYEGFAHESWTSLRGCSIFRPIAAFMRISLIVSYMYRRNTLCIS